MKIVVLSDSHGEFNKLVKIIEKELPDKVIFTGDFSQDGIDLSYAYNKLEFYIVKGNTDVNDYSSETNMEFEAVLA